MNLEFDELYSTVMKIIEVLGTFTFVVSGIRQASAKHFDWFGGFVCGTGWFPVCLTTSKAVLMPM